MHTNFSPLLKTDRIGEVCMVVRRTDGRLIIARKTFYPPEGHRLLTGGIDHDEPIEEAVLRETYEETGLDVEIRRFLAVIEYRDLSQPNKPAKFHTFAFLLDEVGGVLAPIDEHEQLEDFRFVLPEELVEIAGRLEQVSEGNAPDIDGNWRDWGIFRAAAHRIIFETLTG
jgi:8-oxo-dGTP pyrophosphatase MutT (NUDIX family)